MGSAACAAIEAAPDIELCGRSGRHDDLAQALRRSRPDVLVEFTVPDAVERHLTVAIDAEVHVVSGTTGLPVELAARLGERAAQRGVAILLAPNFAIGVLLMQRFARQAAAWFSDVEIVERHHERKLDAPSGTARSTARQIAASLRALPPRRRAEPTGEGGGRGFVEAGVPIHALRLPGSLAHQEVIFGSPGETLTIRHDTLDRGAFMPGVLHAVRRIHTRRGLVDSLEVFLEDPP